MGTFKLTSVVGLYVLIIILFILKQPWDQSLGVQLLISMATPIYGSSLEENTKKTILSFIHCDNHTNEIEICQDTYSLEVLSLTPLHITLLILHYFYFLHFNFSTYSFIVETSSHTQTHYRSQLCIEGHISGLQGFREQIVYLQLLVGSTLKYLSNCTTVIPCTWGLSAAQHYYGHICNSCVVDLYSMIL